MEGLNHILSLRSTIMCHTLVPCTYNVHHLPPVQCTFFFFTVQYMHIHFNLGFIFQTSNNVVSGSSSLADQHTSEMDAWNVNYGASDVLESVCLTPNQIQEVKDQVAFKKAS